MSIRSLPPILLLLAASPALSAPAPAAPNGGKPNNADKLICKTDPDPGSRLGGMRVCHTKAEWDDLRRQTKDNIDHIQNSRAWNS